MNQVYCVLDFETVSEADLPKVGVTEYAKHPSTNILCVAWKIGTLDQLRKVQAKVWSPAIPSSYGDLKRALLDPNVILVAHNVPFERRIVEHVFTKLISDPYLRNIPIERWLCTMSMARALALPAKLEKACAALRLAIQKDMEGHKLMMKMSKPRSVWNTWVKKGRPPRTLIKSEVFPEGRWVGGEPKKWHRKRKDLVRLMQYCVTDIDAEVELLLTLKPLSPSERDTWILDQKINDRGFQADRKLVKKILGMIAQEMRRFEKLTTEITGGAISSINQRAAVLAWLKSNDLYLPNLQKKTVSDALAARLGSDQALRLLDVRANASKTSTAKYEAFEMRSRADGRVRDNIAYHAASTGRFGGMGVQPHNFPRGTIADTDFATEILKDPDTDLELIRLLYGNPLDFFSSLLRSMIQASPGKELLGGDFAGIEVRVLFWIARHQMGLAAFFEGRDLYREIAAVIYGKKLVDVTKPEREVGKRAILGCGFGMGKDKFFVTCKDYGQEIEMDLAADAVSAYRKTHHPVPKLWSNLEKAAIVAVLNPTKKYSVNRTSWFMEGKYLFCELPSGRRLAYYGPEVKYTVTPWGETRPTLYHWDIHPKTKKWIFTHTYGGKLTENVVQAIARDLMVDAMKRAEEREIEILITVHDELLGEKENGKVSVEEFEGMMAETSAWAEGLPVKVEGWKGQRYKK